MYRIIVQYNSQHTQHRGDNYISGIQLVCIPIRAMNDLESTADLKRIYWKAQPAFSEAWCYSDTKHLSPEKFDELKQTFWSHTFSFIPETVRQKFFKAIVALQQ